MKKNGLNLFLQKGKKGVLLLALVGGMLFFEVGCWESSGGKYFSITVNIPEGGGSFNVDPPLPSLYSGGFLRYRGSFGEEFTINIEPFEGYQVAKWDFGGYDVEDYTSHFLAKGGTPGSLSSTFFVGNPSVFRGRFFSESLDVYVHLSKELPEVTLEKDKEGLLFVDPPLPATHQVPFGTKLVFTAYPDEKYETRWFFDDWSDVHKYKNRQNQNKPYQLGNEIIDGGRSFLDESVTIIVYKPITVRAQFLYRGY